MNCGDEDQQKIGFRYVDFFIENGRIYYLCRTAMNGADTFHNSNYSTFGTYTVYGQRERGSMPRSFFTPILQKSAFVFYLPSVS